MIDSGWSTGDKLTAIGLAIGLAGIIATLFTNQFQDWLKRQREYSSITTLGDLSTTSSAQDRVAPGIVKADAETLAKLQEILPSYAVNGVHEKDFGNAFRWEMLESLEKFIWNHTGPEHEFLDSELEELRLQLRQATEELIHLAALYTSSVGPGAGDIRKIPDQYDTNGNYSDRLFFKKSKEINESADRVWRSYTNLVRRARLKLALGAPSDDEG